MSFIQSDNVETHDRDFQWPEQPGDGKTVSEKCVATPGPLETTCKNDVASFSDICSDKAHWSYSKCAKPKAPRRKVKTKVPVENGAGASGGGSSSKNTVEVGISFGIFATGAPSGNLPGVEGIGSLASCESWLDALAIEKVSFCSKAFAINKVFPRKALR